MKYRTPPTLPSFLPSGSSSSTPTHWPLANSVVPQNLSVPVWGDKNSMVWTGALETTVTDRQQGRNGCRNQVQISVLALIDYVTM